MHFGGVIRLAMPKSPVKLLFWVALISYVVAMVGASVGRGLITTDLLDTGFDPETFDGRYADHWLMAALHIAPGALFLLAAPHQLSTKVRRQNLGRHRQVGRVAFGMGLVSALFALAFGVLYPWGGWLQLSASVVFSLYMGYALIEAVRAVRSRDLQRHRPWMIRAVAVGSGVATIRLVLVFGEMLGFGTFDELFGPAFWIGFLINGGIAEIYLRRPARSSPATPNTHVI